MFLLGTCRTATSTTTFRVASERHVFVPAPGRQRGERDVRIERGGGRGERYDERRWEEERHELRVLSIVLGLIDAGEEFDGGPIFRVVVLVSLERQLDLGNIVVCHDQVLLFGARRTSRWW